MRTVQIMRHEFYEPSAEHIARLSLPWCANYSGGKDSTSLVTWVEWLRRTKQITVNNPKLVQSDTLVEYPLLQAISAELMELLRICGWTCEVVTPAINQRLYNRILGVGVITVHAGGSRMRWCTRSTKIDPMKKWRKANNVEGISLTGLRIGESAIYPRGWSAADELTKPPSETSLLDTPDNSELERSGT